jgi:hypothetical protein
MSSGHWLRSVCLVALAWASSAKPLSCQTPLTPDTAVRRIRTQLLATLDIVSHEQKEFQRTHHTYASSAAALDIDNQRTMILAASRSGWSAVAADSTAPGLRCFYRHGDVSPALPGPETRDTPICTGVPDTVIRSPTPANAIVIEEGELANPPQQNNCRTWTDRITAGQAGKGGPGRRAVTQVIVDTTGAVEPTGIRIIEATDINAVMDHLYILSNCGFTPGTIHEVRIRVLVRQQFNIN